MLPKMQYDYPARTTATGVEPLSWGTDKISGTDHVTNFFQTGGTYINSIGLTGGDKTARHVSYANTTSWRCPNGQFTPQPHPA